MRLIDADALMKAMYHRAFETDGDTMWQSGCWVRYRAIEQTVKEQPTIEPMRKRGMWIIRKAPKGYVDYMSCPNCYTEFVRDDEYYFCPNCGSYNGGEKNENQNH